MLFASDWHVDAESAGTESALPAPELFARRAYDLLASGDHAPALDLAVRGTTRFPDYATGWFIRARAEWQMHLQEAALISVERCLAVEPTFLTAWELLASIHGHAGRETLARAAHQRLEELQATVSTSSTALEKSPTHAVTTAARPTRRNALVLVKPAGSFETPTLAEVYRRQGLLDRALEVYRRILERHPEDTGALAMVHKLEDELAARRPAMGAA